MSDYLVDHALKNVWCAPKQDLQVIFEPARISSPVGVRTTINVLWGEIPLPTSTDLYHVYQIGQLSPALYNLLPDQNIWNRLSYVMNNRNLVAELYTNSGLMLPRFEAWLLVTRDRNLLLAVKDQPTITTLKTEPVYLHLYSNAYFSSNRASGSVNMIHAEGIRFTDVNSGLLFQNLYHTYQAKPGYTQLFVNGVYVQDFIPQYRQAGDVIEFVYDSTVKRVVDWNINQLQTFDSVRDNLRKYLLHYAGAQTEGPVIDYQDDIDVYLLKKGLDAANRPMWNGVYYHKNQPAALRMVTHRDYSIAVPYVSSYSTSLPGWSDVTQLSVRLIIRRSGWDRPLINEHHRIKELYKLNDTDLFNAMVGIDSNVDVWRAPSLENSDYVKLMGARYSTIDRPTVQSAYGYNAISKLMADSPMLVQVVNGRRQVSLPPGLRASSTMYEYDANGVLLGYYYHTLGDEYTPINATCTLVESIVGKGSFSIPTVFGENNTPIDPALNYRYYLADINHGLLDNTSWRDVTGDESKVMLVNGKAVWLVDQSIYATAVKSDQDFLAYDLNIGSDEGILRFSIDASATYPSGSAQGVMYIPVGELDLWLNGQALIEGLDYYIDWPQIVIVNKKYLVNGPSQKITVRATGFCNADMTMTPAKDVGFVKYGMLSRNNRFDIRDDKVIRVVVNGGVHDRSELLFSEDDPSVMMQNIPNGSPYVIEDVVVPLRGLQGTDTYTMLAASQAVDQEISDYLTMKLPEQPETLPDIIQDKYPVYSPFSSKIIYDLINGVISMDPYKGQYSDMDVKNALVNYTDLLSYDPTQLGVDSDHVAIHPHNLNVEMVLDIYQYNFLARAIKVYLQNKVDISRFVSIKPGWI